MKKLLLSLFAVLGFSALSGAAPIRYVQISTGAVPIQTGSFNVANGTMTNLNVTGTARISSMTVNNLVISTVTVNTAVVSSVTTTNLSASNIVVSSEVAVNLSVTSAIVNTAVISSVTYTNGSGDRLKVNVATLTQTNISVMTGVTSDTSTNTYSGQNIFMNGISVATSPATPAIFQVGTTTASFSVAGSSKIVVDSGDVSIIGTQTNDNACPSCVGFYISSSVTTSTNFAAADVYADLASLSLPAGDWDVTACMWVTVGGAATLTNAAIGISQTSGNSTSGLILGDNRFVAAGSVVSDFSLFVPNYRQSLSGTTTIYLKYASTYTSGAPQARGRLSARRVR